MSERVVKIDIDWKKIETFLGGTKLAVIILVIYTALMITGTFVESFYGAEFANKLIYKSIFFIFLQAILLISVAMSLMNRLPYKRNLTGFYIVHVGLILIFIGGYLTYHSGIDGQITLGPNSPNRVVLLDDDVLYLRYESGKESMIELPRTAFGKEMNENLDGLNVGTYLPFSAGAIEWVKFPSTQKGNFKTYEYTFATSSKKSVALMTLYPDGAVNFIPSLSIGNTMIKLFPNEIKGCILDDKMEFVVWDRWRNRCGNVEEFGGVIDNTSPQMQHRLVKLSLDGSVYKFVPSFSTMPINERFGPTYNAPVQLISREMLESGRVIVLFGDHGYIYRDGKFNEFETINNGLKKFPELTLNITLNRVISDSYPGTGASFSFPAQNEDGKVSTNKAVKVTAGNEVYWVRSGDPVTFWKGGEQATLFLGKKTYQLPYELTLGKFKMEMSPGTQMPASYESFVNLFDGNGNKVHHIYMNNPLKKDELTFYQSSYFPIGDGQFGSVLSVNMDPGRALKYFGSLLLVLGAIFHYIIRMKMKEVVT